MFPRSADAVTARGPELRRGGEGEAGRQVVAGVEASTALSKPRGEAEVESRFNSGVRCAPTGPGPNPAGVMVAEEWRLISWSRISAGRDYSNRSSS